MTDVGHGGWQGEGRSAALLRGPRGIVEIAVEFNEGVPTPGTNERFGSHDLNEAARYLSFLSNRIPKGVAVRWATGGATGCTASG